ncbi:MAG: DUF92 domain-containing protein [Methanomassiliicoccales archaeon]|nr:DUF92 domain-containing protein [Methanomassiliicoccales archaeon]
MSPVETFALLLALCASLSILAYKFKLLSASGSIASIAVGLIIGWFGSITWLFILIVFVLLGFLVTKYKIKLKMARGLQEGKRGERTYRNVLANGFVPAIIALCSYSLNMQDEIITEIAYLSAISVAAADTTASELGVLSPRTYLITNFSRVEPGTNGGVSLAGTFWAIVAATFASVIGWFAIVPGMSIDGMVLIPIFAGVFGCMIDSVIGATLENRGFVSKLGTNVISMFAGAMIGVILFQMIQ